MLASGIIQDENPEENHKSEPTETDNTSFREKILAQMKQEHNINQLSFLDSEINKKKV